MTLFSALPHIKERTYIADFSSDNEVPLIISDWPKLGTDFKGAANASYNALRRPADPILHDIDIDTSIFAPLALGPKERILKISSWVKASGTDIFIPHALRGQEPFVRTVLSVLAQRGVSLKKAWVQLNVHQGDLQAGDALTPTSISPHIDVDLPSLLRGKFRIGAQFAATNINPTEFFPGVYDLPENFSILSLRELVQKFEKLKDVATKERPPVIPLPGKLYEFPSSLLHRERLMSRAGYRSFSMLRIFDDSYAVADKMTADQINNAALTRALKCR